MKKTLLYPSIQIVRHPPANYEEMHTSKKGFIHLKETIDPVYLVDVRNAFVTPFGIVFKHGFVIKESVYSMFRSNSYYASFYKKYLLNKVMQVHGDCVIAHNAYFQNYYHWLLEAVPRLYLMREQAPQLKLILHENSSRFVHQYVELFNFKEIVYVPEDEIVKADRLLFTTFTSRGLAMHEPIIREMVQWLFEKNGIVPHPATRKKVFITRKSARYRRLLNEQEVIDYLITKEVEIVTLEDLTVQAQMQLFADAAYVIGTQGAGMANMIYSVHAKMLVTIIHEEHPDDAYYNLTNINGTECYYFQCKGTGNFDFKNNDDLAVDMPRFKSLMEKIL